MTLTRTNTYKVHVKTANEAHATLWFNVPPTADMIADALWLTKVNVPEPSEQERARCYDNLIALAKLAEIKLPEAGRSESYNVMVAGVYVGHVSVVTQEAWTA